MRRNQTVMTSRICEKCHAALSDHDSVCPACGASAPPVSQTPPSKRKSRFRKLPVIIIGIVAAGAAAVLYFVFSTGTLPSTNAKPEVVDTVDLGAIRTKAEHGDVDEQEKLGRIYARGDVVNQDYKEAAKWYRQAADREHAGAQAALGELYEAGQGVPKDYAEAAKWYRRAAEQGDIKGQYSLAVLYVMGNGVPRDSNEAMKWYRQAADQGDELAQYNLGMRYYEGSGVKADPVEAYQWLSLAAAQGVRDAVQARDALTAKVTREQLAEGRRRAAAFVIKKTSKAR
jgi:TPR repeat protein